MEQGDQEIIDNPNTASNHLEAVNRAEIDMQISTAHRYPRHIERATSKMKAMVGKSPEVAGECYYMLPRGGKQIEGPSVRLAEIIAINYGNIRVVTRPPMVGEDEVTVEWAAHDLESNYATTGAVSTPIRRSPKNGQQKGERYPQDMINVACLATTAKARRNGIYAIVPGTLVKELLEQARYVVSGGDKPIETRRENAMSYFRKLGISDERILHAVSRTAVEQLTGDDLVKLHGIATAIRENQTTIDEAFPDPNARQSFDPSKTRTSQVSEAVKGKQDQPPQSEQPESETAEQDAPTEPNEEPFQGESEPEAPAAGGDEADAAPEPPPDPQPEVEAAPADPADESPEEQAITALSAQANVDREAAAERLATYCNRVYRADLTDLEADQIKDLLDRIANGKVKMKQ